MPLLPAHASLEYAVKVGTKLIVVLGHTGCGAVIRSDRRRATGEPHRSPREIHPAVAAGGCDNSKDDACVTKVAEMNVRLALQQIREKSPYIISKALDDGKIRLVGAL